MLIITTVFLRIDSRCHGAGAHYKSTPKGGEKLMDPTRIPIPFQKDSSNLPD